MNYLGMALTPEEIEGRRIKNELRSSFVFREFWTRRMWMAMVR